MTSGIFGWDLTDRTKYPERSGLEYMQVNRQDAADLKHETGKAFAKLHGISTEHKEVCWMTPAMMALETAKAQLDVLTIKMPKKLRKALDDVQECCERGSWAYKKVCALISHTEEHFDQLKTQRAECTKDLRQAFECVEADAEKRFRHEEVLAKKELELDTCKSCIKHLQQELQTAKEVQAHFQADLVHGAAQLDIIRLKAKVEEMQADYALLQEDSTKRENALRDKWQQHLLRVRFRVMAEKLDAMAFRKKIKGRYEEHYSEKDKKMNEIVNRIKKMQQEWNIMNEETEKAKKDLNEMARRSKQHQAECASQRSRLHSLKQQGTQRAMFVAMRAYLAMKQKQSMLDQCKEELSDARYTGEMANVLKNNVRKANLQKVLARWQAVCHTVLSTVLRGRLASNLLMKHKLRQCKPSECPNTEANMAHMVERQRELTECIGQRDRYIVRLQGKINELGSIHSYYGQSTIELQYAVNELQLVINRTRPGLHLLGANAHYLSFDEHVKQEQEKVMSEKYGEC